MYVDCSTGTKVENIFTKRATLFGILNGEGRDFELFDNQGGEVWDDVMRNWDDVRERVVVGGGDVATHAPTVGGTRCRQVPSDSEGRRIQWEGVKERQRLNSPPPTPPSTDGKEKALRAKPQFEVSNLCRRSSIKDL